MQTMTATYTPEDNKLRLYTMHRLDQATYAAVSAVGLRFAPKQDFFVAPAWTPEREDVLLALCGEIEDEQSTVADRAACRSERFEGYSDRRLVEAAAARIRPGVQLLAVEIDARLAASRRARLTTRSICDGCGLSRRASRRVRPGRSHRNEAAVSKWCGHSHIEQARHLLSPDGRPVAILANRTTPVGIPTADGTGRRPHMGATIG